jgi:hypothetical protein
VIRTHTPGPTGAGSQAGRSAADDGRDGRAVLFSLRILRARCSHVGDVIPNGQPLSGAWVEHHRDRDTPCAAGGRRPSRGLSNRGSSPVRRQRTHTALAPTRSALSIRTGKYPADRKKTGCALRRSRSRLQRRGHAPGGPVAAVTPPHATVEFNRGHRSTSAGPALPLAPHRKPSHCCWVHSPKARAGPRPAAGALTVRAVGTGRPREPPTQPTPPAVKTHPLVLFVCVCHRLSHSSADSCSQFHPWQICPAAPQ